MGRAESGQVDFFPSIEVPVFEGAVGCTHSVGKVTVGEEHLQQLAQRALWVGPACTANTGTPSVPVPASTTAVTVASA